MQDEILEQVIRYTEHMQDGEIESIAGGFSNLSVSPKFQKFLGTVALMDTLYIDDKMSLKYLPILKIILKENDSLERMTIDRTFNFIKLIEYVFINCKMLSVFDIMNLDGASTFSICGINWRLGTMVKLEIHSCQLDFVNNGVSTFHLLCSGLKGNKYISELCITHCFLTDVHCQDMVNLLSSTKCVSALVIYGNNFKADSIHAICSAIKESNTIRKLDLSQKNMDTKSLLHLFEFVEEYQNLEGLALFEVKLEDEAVELLNRVLKKSRLTSLNCLGSKTTAKGFKALTETIAHHEYLEEVDLTDIDAGDHHLQCKYVGEMIRINKTMYKLVFENFDTLYIDEIINGLKDNFYLSGINQEDEDNHDFHLIEYTDRNKIIHNHAALDFINGSRALIITTFPNDLKLYICRYLAVGCMIPKSKQKLIVSTFLDFKSIGSLASDEDFSRSVLLDACTKHQNENKS
ncbi:hypothetical protein HDV01_006800 [Terramyces sp. JEL0728]|nr:hypothetical protein HDV01_006800 [Terramyces sp. JEL0728]